MSPRNIAFQNLSKSFPRVSGDEPGALNIKRAMQQFSPRERG